MPRRASHYPPLLEKREISMRSGKYTNIRFPNEKTLTFNENATVG